MFKLCLQYDLCSDEADKILRDAQTRLSLRTVSVQEIDARVNDIKATLSEAD